jgi:serine/threonine-protein kinase
MLTGSLLGGRYRIGRVLGHGGMGAVYEAVQEGLGRRVAVKVVHPHLSAQPDLVERFRREAQAAAALGHPNIVQVTDYGAGGADPAFLVMELLQGASLAQVIESEKQLPGNRVAFIASQALEALSAAHAAGIVHRDIKPDNLFLTSIAGVTDVVKVLDFGVAKLADPSAKLTTTGAMLGTPAYMAPEQARGLDVDPRSDIYAVGACMYHALTGKFPFEGVSYNALLFAIAEKTPTAIDRPDVDPRLIAVVERAMHKDPDQRYQTAREMIAALAPWSLPSGTARMSAPPDPHAATHAGTTAKSGSPPVIVTRPPPKSRTLLAAMVTAVFVLGAGAAVYFLWLRGRRHDAIVVVTPPPEPTPTTTPSPTPTPTPTPAPTPTASASATASATASAATVVPVRKRTGGKTARLTSINTNRIYSLDVVRAAVERLGGSINACYAASELDPVDHRYRDFFVSISPSGAVSVAAKSSKGSPLDACMQGVLSRLSFGKPDKPEGGQMMLGFTSAY